MLTDRAVATAPATARDPLRSERRASPAVFVDKDGTIVRDVPFNVDPRKIELLPGAVEGLRAFVRAGFTPVIVTNQSGVALGHFSEPQLLRYLLVLTETLDGLGVRIAATEYCPHAATEAGTPWCGCRKPGPLMLLRSSRRLGLDLGSSWMIGDTLDDVEAGKRAGCRSAFIGALPSGHVPSERTPEVVADDIRTAAHHVLARGSIRIAEGSR